MTGPRTNEGPPSGAERPVPAAPPPSPQGPSTWRDLAERLIAQADVDPIGGFYPIGELLKLEAAAALRSAADALDNAPILDHPSRIPTLQPADGNGHLLDLARRLDEAGELPLAGKFKREIYEALLNAVRIPQPDPPEAPAGGWAVVLVCGFPQSIAVEVIPVPSLEDGETVAKALEARIRHATAVVVRHLGPR